MRFLVLVFLLAACAGRPLTEGERAFSQAVLGPGLQADQVRVVRGAVVGMFTATYPPRPRTTCRERIYPPTTEPLTGRYSAFALGHRLYFRRDLWRRDYLADYPQALDLPEAMMLAHELTHVWQWQNRASTGYHPMRAASEHGAAPDPYLTEFDPTRPFDHYSYEQQGVLVEEWMCCHLLDPDAPRTEALGRLLDGRFRRRLDQAFDPERVRMPWDGVELDGICS